MRNGQAEAVVAETRERVKEFKFFPDEWGAATGTAREKTLEGGEVSYEAQLSISAPPLRADQGGYVIRAVNEAASWVLREVELMKAEREGRIAIAPPAP